MICKIVCLTWLGVSEKSRVPISPFCIYYLPTTRAGQGISDATHFNFSLFSLEMCEVLRSRQNIMKFFFAFQMKHIIGRVMCWVAFLIFSVNTPGMWLYLLTGMFTQCAGVPVHWLSFYNNSKLVSIKFVIWIVLWSSSYRIYWSLYLFTVTLEVAVARSRRTLHQHLG